MPRHHLVRCYDVNMRATLVIEDDVLDRARSVSARRHEPFRRVISEALRGGLRTIEEPARSRPYNTQPHGLGLRAGRNLDNTQSLLAQIEGEDHR